MVKRMVFFWLCMVCCATVCAAEGRVVWTDPTCINFVALLGDEYGLYETRGGKPPAEGDTLTGNLTGEGLVDIENATAGHSNQVILVATSVNRKALIYSAATVTCQRRFKPS